ncbi:hypothetical protein GCM10023196_061840 [Actinoallomurus vinaceus]|uniref:Right handed beta helix domain-containing protein n=1 Tax=Actinoallomurus vinaceus TaxID=1080074 RepID=A0ABP8UI03_9ACTN
MTGRARLTTAIVIAAVAASVSALLVGWAARGSPSSRRARPGATAASPGASAVGGGTTRPRSEVPSLQVRSGPGSPAPPRWPDAATTGPRPGTRLQVRTGTIKVTTDGAVLDGLEVHGDIVVLARNVTIRNCRVIGAGDWAILQRMEAGSGGLTVEDTEISGGGGRPLEFGVLNFAGDLTVRRVNVHAMMSAVQTSQGLIEDSYFHDPKDFPGAHVTLVASGSGPRPGMTFVVRHNAILNPGGQTAAVALYQDFGLNHDVLVQDNLLAGGGYTVYGGAGKYGRPHHIRFIGNVFSRRYFSKGGAFGWGTTWDDSAPGNQWKKNTWEDTGSPVPAP